MSSVGWYKTQGAMLPVLYEFPEDIRKLKCST